MRVAHAGTKLRVWAYTRGLLLKEVAARIGIGPNNLSRVIHGHAKPSADHRFAIDKLTGGEIPADSWTHETTKPVDSATRAA